MKYLKKGLSILSVSIFITFSCSNVYGNIFNDVKQDNIAYSSIEKMVNLGIMVGDLQGNFRPDSAISKFEAVKILSKLVENDTNIDISKSKYNDIVLKYDAKYSKWDSSSNSFMVLLLEKGILKEEDLEHFIILDKNNKEQIRALSKEEIALFLSRIENKEDIINDMNFEKTFLDNKDINLDKVKACYYMDSLGIVTATDNIFNPKKAVLKYELAIILDKFLQHTNINIKSTTIEPIENSTIQTRFVTIEKIFVEKHSIQVKIGDETKIYDVNKAAQVYIDDVLYDLSSLKINSNAEITIKNNSIFKIDVKSNLKIEDIQNEKNIKLYGTIKTVSDGSIGLSYKEIDDNGFYSKEKIDIIPLSPNCKITKSGVNLKDIKQNSLATVILENKVATQIILESENVIFIGSIIEKSKDKVTIKTTDNKIFEASFVYNAKITRNDKEATIKDLKIGDSVNLKMEDDKIINLDSKSIVSRRHGIVKSIKINKKSSFIEIEDSKNNVITYYADNLTTDVYSIKVLDNVTLYLDSLEIYAIDIIDRKYNKNFSGEVIEVGDNYITISTQDLTNTNTIKVFTDKDTKFFSYNTLESFSLNHLKKGDKVYIVLKDNVSNVASNLNIVSK